MLPTRASMDRDVLVLLADVGKAVALVIRVEILPVKLLPAPRIRWVKSRKILLPPFEVICPDDDVAVLVCGVFPADINSQMASSSDCETMDETLDFCQMNRPRVSTTHLLFSRVWLRQGSEDHRGENC